MNKALDTYAGDEDQPKSDAAMEIIESGLKSKGYLDEGT